MTSPAYALLPVIAVLALLLWLQTRRGDRLRRKCQRHQIEALWAQEEALRWRHLADRAISVTCDMAGRVADGDLDPGLLIHTAGTLQRARLQADQQAA